MRPSRLNALNAVLMIASCAAAIAAPFHLFLFAYAILGPLHYLTEISWLHERDYFLPHARSRRVWFAVVALAMAAVVYGFVAGDLLHRDVPPAAEIGLVYLAFAGAAIALFVRRPANVIAMLVVAAIAISIFSGSAAYGIASILLVTFIHVFVFTGAFVLFGAIKAEDRGAIATLVVFVACAATALLIRVPPLAPSGAVAPLYAGFEMLNRILLSLGRTPAGVYDSAALGVMRLIAFAYTYHYLNWFSKTSIIRWHEVSRRRGVAIVAGWLSAISLYAISYRVGFAASYAMSMLHVLAEFPLNHQVFASIGRSMRKLVFATTLLLFVACSARPPHVERVAFETSKGTFVVEAHRDWAPHAFDRFHELVASRFFDGARFFRVRAGYIAQFGIPADPKLAQQWEHRTMPDDPVRQTNARGMLAFASLPDANSRTTQIYINLADNPKLDPQGFAPFARVVSGMDVVDALYAGYGETSGGGMRAGHQQTLFAEGNAYLEREFPKLDFIVRADFVESPARTTR